MMTGSDGSSLAVKLDEYLAALNAIGGEFYRRAAVQDGEIAEVEASLGCRIPEQVLAFWRWSNVDDGVRESTLADARLFPGGSVARLSSSDVAGELKRNWEEWNEPEVVAGLRPEKCLRLVDYGHTLWLMVSLDEADAGSIWVWKWLGRRCFPTGWGSMEDLVTTYHELVAAGAIAPVPFGDRSLDVAPDHRAVLSQPDWFLDAFDIQQPRLRE